MSWGRVLLILGAVLGGIVVLFGLLGLIGSLTDSTMSPSDVRDGVIGSIFIIGVGLTIFVPCLAVLIFVRPKNNLPVWQPGGPYMATPPGAAGPMSIAPLAQAPDLKNPYLEWFGWCQREIGGNAIVLNSATMAALSRGVAGDSSSAVQAARRAAQTASSSAPPAQQRKVGGAKVKLLARIGAATLPLLEPDETVIASLYGIDRQPQMWHVAFGVIGYLIAASQSGAYYVTVTDRRVIVLSAPQLGGRPRALVFAVPRSMVTEVSYKQGIVRDTLVIARVTDERNRIVVARMWRQEGLLVQHVLAPGLFATPMPQPPMLR